MAEQMIDMEFEQAPKDTAFPIFKFDKEIDEQASKEAGKTVFRDVEIVQIIVPGDRTFNVVKPVGDRERKRWAVQYKAFKDGHEQLPDGYPLNQWPFATPALVASLKEMHCYTLEQFAVIPDSAITDLPRAMELREKARKFLAKREDSKEMNRLEAALDEANQQLKAKDEKLAALSKRLDVLEEMNREQRDTASPRRGRPPKNPPGVE